MYKNNQKYCKKSYFGVDVQGVTGSSPVSSTNKFPQSRKALMEFLIPLYGKFLPSHLPSFAVFYGLFEYRCCKTVANFQEEPIHCATASTEIFFV